MLRNPLDRSTRIVRLSMIVAASLVATSSEAGIKTLYVPQYAVPADFDALEAVSALNAKTIYSNVGWVCSQSGLASPTRLEATGAKFTVTCADGTHVAMRYDETYAISVNKESGYNGIFVVMDRVTKPSHFSLGFTVEDQPLAQAISDFWLHLGRPRPELDPATDAAFQAALQAERSAPTPEEDLRRTQAQAEALLQAGRTFEAARMYRDRLAKSPLWASGHYNLGLVYGDLELYPEAINEMRRYLYLSPQAADARAAQDQVYKWEALAPGGPIPTNRSD
jgi:tetratricopeptide (TPR) repeat protein